MRQAYMVRRGCGSTAPRRGEGGRTKAQLYAEAKRKGIKGRSRMTKDELLTAVDR